METLQEEIARRDREYEREHNIFCPFCGEKMDEVTRDEFISYDGLKDHHPCICPACDKTFFVKEIVDRIWETSQVKDS